MKINNIFKNKVGRPSNETIKKRRIFCILAILVICALLIYLFIYLFNISKLSGSILDALKPVDISVTSNVTVDKYQNYATDYTLKNNIGLTYYYKWFTYSDSNAKGSVTYVGDCTSFKKTVKLSPTLNVSEDYPNRSGKYRIYLLKSACTSDTKGTSKIGYTTEKLVNVSYKTVSSGNTTTKTTTATTKKLSLKEQLKIAVDKANVVLDEYQQYKSKFTLNNLTGKTYYYRWFKYVKSISTSNLEKVGDCTSYKKTKNLTRSLTVSQSNPIRLGKFKVYSSKSACTSDKKGTSSSNVVTEQSISVKYYDNPSERTNKNNGLLDSKEVTYNKIILDKVKNYTGVDGYSGIQGFAADDEYFYVAFNTEKVDDNYVKSNAMIVKIDISTGKVVKRSAKLTVGHANALTYNPETKKLYISPCSKAYPYVFEMDTNLENLKKVYLKDKNGKIYTQYGYSSMIYSPGRNIYLNTGNNRFNIYDSNFKYLKYLSLDSTLKKYTPQSAYADVAHIYFINSDMPSNKHYTNYIDIFDYNGIHQKTITIPDSKLVSNGSRYFELEQMTRSKGKYYFLANVKGNGNEFAIYQINFKDDSKYEIAFVNLNTSATKLTHTYYQTVTYGVSTKLKKVDFNETGKTFEGYYKYRDYDNKYYVNVNGKGSWHTKSEINKLIKDKKKVELDLVTASSVSKSISGGKNIMFIAKWKGVNEGVVNK